MPKPEQKRQVDFGYQRVDADQKAKLVDGVFHAVADRYDLMNDVMSLGMHRLWKAKFVSDVRVRPGQTILDLASGTGDIAKALVKRLRGQGQIVASDINLSMLSNGRRRLMDSIALNGLEFVVADAQNLPFASEQFDAVTMAFGLRNVTDQPAALKEMLRVLKLGGRALVMDFSRPTFGSLRAIYDAYSFNIIPKMGEYIGRDRAAYQYLVESIRKHPDQAKLRAMFEAVGFDCCQVQNLSGGIVAIHTGVKVSL